MQWLLLGSSATVTIAGGVLLALALSAKSKVESPRPNSSWADIKSDYNRVSPLSTAGFALLGAGVAGIAGSLVWAYVRKPGEETRVSVKASATGLSVSGVF
jgi:hypothetical protein